MQAWGMLKSLCRSIIIMTITTIHAAHNSQTPLTCIIGDVPPHAMSDQAEFQIHWSRIVTEVREESIPPSSGFSLVWKKAQAVIAKQLDQNSHLSCEVNYSKLPAPADGASAIPWQRYFTLLTAWLNTGGVAPNDSVPGSVREKEDLIKQFPYQFYPLPIQTVVTLIHQIQNHTYLRVRLLPKQHISILQWLAGLYQNTVLLPIPLDKTISSHTFLSGVIQRLTGILFSEQLRSETKKTPVMRSSFFQGFVEMAIEYIRSAIRHPNQECGPCAQLKLYFAITAHAPQAFPNEGFKIMSQSLHKGSPLLATFQQNCATPPPSIKSFDRFLNSIRRPGNAHTLSATKECKDHWLFSSDQKPLNPFDEMRLILRNIITNAAIKARPLLHPSAHTAFDKYTKQCLEKVQALDIREWHYIQYVCVNGPLCAVIAFQYSASAPKILLTLPRRIAPQPSLPSALITHPSLYDRLLTIASCAKLPQLIKEIIHQKKDFLLSPDFFYSIIADIFSAPTDSA